jgi:glycine betaine catabolism A
MSAQAQPQFRGDIAGPQNLVPIIEMIAPETFAREQEKIFRRSWLLLAREEDVPDPGSFRTLEVPPARAALLLVRGQDGQLRCFHNICRHRGYKLALATSGCQRRFTCGFHGWVFSNEGELVHVTDEHMFPGLEKGDFGLLPVALETWEGFVFVNLDRTPRQSLRAWLGELFDQYGGYFGRNHSLGSVYTEVNCNWHLAMNAFGEGYHTMYIHKSTMPDYQGGKSNPQRHRPFMQSVNLHSRYSAPANPDHQFTAAEAIAWRYGHKMIPAAEIGPKHDLPVGINPAATENWLFDVVTLFPNFVFLLGQHWHMEMTFWPLSHDRTRIHNAFFGYEARNWGERISQQFALALARDVVREDASTLEAQQQALSSGAMDRIVLSRQEAGLIQHYRAVQEMLAAA